MAFVTAYFDESGTHDGSPFLCVASLLFSRDAIAKLEPAWRAMLDRYGIQYFHMTDCAADPGYGEFAGMSESERIEVSIEAHRLTAEHASFGGAIAIDRGAVHLIPNRGLFKTAYTFACWGGLLSVRNWASSTGYAGDIDYVFESGHPSRNEADRVMRELFSFYDTRRDHRYASHRFEDKRHVIPLQCADIFAWHMLKQANRERAGLTDLRTDFKALNARRVLRFSLYGADNLRELDQQLARSKMLDALRKHEVRIVE